MGEGYADLSFLNSRVCSQKGKDSVHQYCTKVLYLMKLLSKGAWVWNLITLQLYNGTEQ